MTFLFFLKKLSIMKLITEAKSFKKKETLRHKNSFVRGLASTFDIFGFTHGFIIYNSTEADKKALQSDWENVGEDINNALQKFNKKHVNKISFK